MAIEKRKSSGDAGPPHKKVRSDHNGVHPDRQRLQNGSGKPQDGKDGFLNGTSSKEAHYKQKQLRAERVAAKPNADNIARSKKIWERLRIKSAVPKDERKKLVEELFSIITGRVKDFVFKHDSVRVVQCAIKYATPEQKTQIAQELKGSYRELAESKYAKFLVAKLITSDSSAKGENKVRDVVVPEFYGHVKRMIRHPEASWIMDDIYRTIASPQQKARLLREWYGGEFALQSLQNKHEEVTADLAQILKESPGKKSPIMQQLKEMTNQLVQKKTTGFTMLHDALLQYFLNCNVGSPEHGEFLEMLRDDEEGDLFKNLAFTKSGSRIVCLALAYGSSKDRRVILKHYKTHMKLMAADTWAHIVLLAAYEVIDDTVMTAKAIFPELTSKDLDSEAQQQETMNMALNINARIPLLYLMAEDSPKWLLDTADHEMLKEIRQIRKETSKKDPSTRRTELNKVLSQPLLDFIASQAETLLQSSYGCQFIGEVLLGAIGDKQASLNTLSSLAIEEHTAETLVTPHAGRLYKTLVQGGRFDPVTKTVTPSDPPLGFGNLLFDTLSSHSDDTLLSWATSSNSWSLVAMLENEQFEHKEDLVKYLQTHAGDLQSPKEDGAANAGTKVLLERIGGSVEGGGKDAEKESKSAKQEDSIVSEMSETKDKKPKKEKKTTGTADNAEEQQPKKKKSKKSV
ncbi:Pumilio y domain member 6 [Lithohypha guttulata]|uniref:Pumilio y domain member 6 n=1 Tax=Lithohypha guttulata TaxID=1690604 RepID=UPI002DDED7A1|nr:Pumilio y domain member 6 [Lithohypha guttulata]